jgi:hypothetical protein
LLITGSAISILLCGLVQIYISLYILIPVVLGDTIITEQFANTSQIHPSELFYATPWLVIGIASIILGVITFIRPENQNSHFLGTIIASIPLEISSTYYLINGPSLWTLGGLIGIATIVLTILARK